MLTKPGAIWDEARALYKEFDPTAKIRLRDMKIKFGPVTDPEKRAEVSFTHFERAENTDNFQGLNSGPFMRKRMSNKLSKRGTSSQDYSVLKEISLKA